jgi:hypothetical protein
MNLKNKGAAMTSQNRAGFLGGIAVQEDTFDILKASATSFELRKSKNTQDCVPVFSLSFGSVCSRQFSTRIVDNYYLQGD